MALPANRASGITNDYWSIEVSLAGMVKSDFGKLYRALLKSTSTVL